MTRSTTRALILSLGLASAVGCTSPAEVGEECADSADCVLGSSCFEHVGADVSPVCMPDCDLNTTRLCSDGAVCTRATGPDRPTDLGVCYLGGTTAVGGSCTTNLECAQGSICVSVGGAQACYRACSTDDGAPCDDSETCSPLEDMGTNGFCEPAA